jgi:hypothetical protein
MRFLPSSGSARFLRLPARGRSDLHRLCFLVISAGMKAEHHARRRRPGQYGSRDVLFARARSLEDSTANTRLEDYPRRLVPELARIGDNGLSGDGPPPVELGGEVPESPLGVHATFTLFTTGSIETDLVVMRYRSFSFLWCLWQAGAGSGFRALRLFRHIGSEGVERLLPHRICILPQTGKTRRIEGEIVPRAVPVFSD